MTPDPYRYYRHLIFDHSLTETNYAFSGGHATLPSRLELIDGKLPVSKRHFVSPPNSLKLHLDVPERRGLASRTARRKVAGAGAAARGRCPVPLVLRGG